MEKFIFGADKFRFSCLFRTGIYRNFRDTSSNLFSFKDFILNKPVWGCGWFKLSVESLYPGLSKLTKNIHLKSSAPYISYKSSLSGFWLFPGRFLLLFKKNHKKCYIKMTSHLKKLATTITTLFTKCKQTFRDAIVYYLRRNKINSYANSRSWMYVLLTSDFVYTFI